MQVVRGLGEWRGNSGCPGDQLLPLYTGFNYTHYIQDLISAAIYIGFKNLQLRAPGCSPVEAGEVPLLCPVMRLFCSSPSRGRLDKAGLHGRAMGSHEFLLELKQSLWMRLRAGILPLKWGRPEGLGVNFGWAGSEWPSPAPWEPGTALADPARLRLTPPAIRGRALQAGAELLPSAPSLAGKGENCFFFFLFPPLSSQRG